MRNPRHYSGTATLLIWLGAVTFGITFWAGVSCLVAHFIKG
jgi:hypothetical protein